MWDFAKAMTHLPQEYPRNEVWYEDGIFGCYNLTGDEKLYCSECMYSPCLKIKDWR